MDKEDEEKSPKSAQMKRIGERRKQPKYVFHFDRRWVLYMNEDTKCWMGILQVSSWAIDRFGFHIHFTNPQGSYPGEPLRIVFHLPTGLPISVHMDEKSAKIAVKRLESGIDPMPALDQIDTTLRKWSDTNDDIPF